MDKYYEITLTVEIMSPEHYGKIIERKVLCRLKNKQELKELFINYALYVFDALYRYDGSKPYIEQYSGGHVAPDHISVNNGKFYYILHIRESPVDNCGMLSPFTNSYELLPDIDEWREMPDDMLEFLNKINR